MSAVEDWFEIFQLQHEYARRFDEPQSPGKPADAERIARQVAVLFTEDGRWSGGHRDDLYVGREQLRRGFTDRIRAARQGKGLVRVPVLHVMTNPVIKIHDDQAEGNWYMLCFHFSDESRTLPGSLKYAGTYSVQYHRSDQGWRIVQMHLDVHSSAPTD